MKRFGYLIVAWLALAALCVGQLPYPASQSFTEVVTLAPPAINTAQSFSNGTGTGISQVATGGSIAAGSYRVCVTLFSSTNTETPCSTDTATSSVITTTGSTSVITIQPPVANVSTNANNASPQVVGWRVYVGASGGASGAESLQTITASVCTLSSSSTASCSLTSPAVFTVSTNFSGSGTAPPSTPGTLIYPPVTNAANQYLFENSLYRYRVINWVVSGTAPSACTFNVQTGTTVAGLANVGQTITCTASGTYALALNTTAVYSAINVATFTAGDTTTNVVFYESAQVFNPVGNMYVSNAVPTENCALGMLDQNTAASSGSTALYVCSATNTWTAVTVP